MEKTHIMDRANKMIINVKDKIYNIEFLRILLICAIIVHHFYHRTTNIWNSGSYAVEFFFIISGFIFLFTFNPTKNLIEYMLPKLIRFQPVSVLTAIIIALCFANLDIYRLLTDLFLLAHTGLYKANSGFGYNSPAWFISVLFWIFIFYFYVQKTLPKQKNLILGLITFFALIYPIVFGVPPYFRLFRGLGAFGIGYFAAVFCQNYQRNSDSLSLKYTLIELILFLYITILLFTINKGINDVALLFCMAILLILFYMKKGHLSYLLDNKIWQSCSKYVLTVFLSHAILYQPLFQIIKMNYPEYISQHVICVCILGVIASWIFGIVIYYLVYRPSVKYLNNIFLNHNNENKE